MSTIRRTIMVGVITAVGAFGLAPIASAAPTGTTMVTIAARPNPATSTAPVGLSSKVKPTSGVTHPTGQVCFYNGTSTTALGCGTLKLSSNNIMVTHVKVTLAKGTYSIVAKYSGDTNYLPNSSKSITLVVT